MSEVFITLPIPPLALRPNGRAHWAVKAKAAKIARKQGRNGALIAYANVVAFFGMFNGGCQVTGVPSMKLARVFPTVYTKDRRAKWDRDNLIASLKNYMDGIADAGVVANDRDFRWADPVFEIDKANPRVELVITSMESKQ